MPATLTPVSLLGQTRRALRELPGVEDVSVLVEPKHVTVILYGNPELETLESARWRVAGLIDVDRTFTVEIRRRG